MNSHLDVNWRTAYFCAALRLAETLVVSLSNTPLLRLLESNVCESYYRKHDPGVIPVIGDIPEALCKIPNVQSIISDLNGTDSVVLLVPGLLAALPYVSLNGRSNKRRTLLINVVGNLLMNAYYILILSFGRVFDPRWIWLRGIFSFVGGGDLVFYSLSQALIAESLPQNYLSTFYLYTTALALVVKLFGSISSLEIMNISIWPPIALSLAMKTLTMIIITYIVPKPITSHKEGGPDSSQLLAEYEVDLSEQELDSTEPPKFSPPIQSSLAKHVNTIWRYRQPLGVCALQEIGMSYRYILPYWLSRRYKWTLQETGWIFTAETLLTASIVAVQPYCFKRIHKGNSHERDLDLAKMCLGFVTSGLLLLGVTWYKLSAVICLSVIAGGTPFRDAYMSHLTARLQKQEITEMYIYLSMIQLSAFSLGAWTVASLDAFCLRIGGSWWTSIPIWLCCIASASAALLAG